MPQTWARGDPSKAAPIIRWGEGRYANYLFLVFLIGSPIVLAVDCEFCAWFLVVLIYDAAAAAASIASMSNLQRAVAPRRGRDSFSRSTRKREQEKEKKEDG